MRCLSTLSHTKEQEFWWNDCIAKEAPSITVQMFKYYKWTRCSLRCIVLPSVSMKSIWELYILCNLLWWGSPTKDSYLPLSWTKFHNFNDPGKGFSKRNCIANFLQSKEQFLTYSNAPTIWVSKAEVYSFQKKQKSIQTYQTLIILYRIMSVLFLKSQRRRI